MIVTRHNDLKTKIRAPPCQHQRGTKAPTHKTRGEKYDKEELK
jgi:hypothetical protein